VQRSHGFQVGLNPSATENVNRSEIQGLGILIKGNILTNPPLSLPAMVNTRGGIMVYSIISEPKQPKKGTAVHDTVTAFSAEIDFMHQEISNGP
jgi:hypothetical protein